MSPSDSTTEESSEETVPATTGLPPRRRGRRPKPEPEPEAPVQPLGEPGVGGCYTKRGGRLYRRL